VKLRVENANPDVVLAWRVWFVVSVAGALTWTIPFLFFPYILFVAVFTPWPLWVLWAIVPALALIRGARASLARQIPEALWSLAVPAAALVLFCYGHLIGEFAHFQLVKASYNRVVADARHGRCGDADREKWWAWVDMVDCGDPVTIVFPWFGWGASWFGVVYDAGDEIIMPARQRSAAWKHREIGSLLSCSGAERRLAGHYYFAGGSYVGGTDECG
jgi:hypothetical protein